MYLSATWATDVVLTDDCEREKYCLNSALEYFVSKHDFYPENSRISIDKWVRSNKAVPDIAEVFSSLAVKAHIVVEKCSSRMNSTSWSYGD